MAHIRAYGEVCPEAAGIIHLGATSCYVTDNADMILIRDAFAVVRAKLVTVIRNLAAFAEENKSLPCLASVSYTHLLRDQRHPHRHPGRHLQRLRHGGYGRDRRVYQAHGSGL